MAYISTKEAAAQWQVSDRQVRKWCVSGAIPGCLQAGRSWQIPANALKPTDKRTREGKQVPVNHDHLELIMNAEYCLHAPPSLINDNDRILCELSDLMLQGHLREVLERVKAFYYGSSNDYMLAALFLHFTVAVYLGEQADVESVGLSIQKLLETGRYPLTLAYMALHRGIDNHDIAYMNIPPESLSVMLYRSMRLQLVHCGQPENGPLPIHMELYTKHLELLNNTEVLAYAHAQVASYYYFLGNDELHDLHVEKALEIILPRKWYLIIAEHSLFVDWHLEKYVDADTRAIIQALANQLSDQMIKHPFEESFKRDNDYESYRLFKLAFLLVGKKTREEACEILDLSMYQIKRYTAKLYELSGTDNRKDFAEFWVKQVEKI
ncbi:MAG: helix-turn-helix domain-containing protein [Lachnospiraceae bacterium]|nr:helix-turn-helix domain-containing protein [Lachnospiraceae bacterium]